MRTDTPEDNAQLVRVTDIDIPFWQMVALLIKLVFAAIPAAIIFSIVTFLVTASLNI